MEVERLPRRARLERSSARALLGLGRLCVPLLRRADEYQEIAWDDAFKLAGRRLSEGGAVAVERALSVETGRVLEDLRGLVPTGDAVLTLGPVRSGAAFRAHCVEFLSPEVVAAGGDEVLLLPISSRFSQEGGAVWTGPDGVHRFSPEIRGNPVAGARPDWSVLAGIGRVLDPGGFDFDSAAGLRAAIARAEGWTGLDRLESPGSRLVSGEVVGR